jgi:hypothetical protein
MSLDVTLYCALLAIESVLLSVNPPTGKSAPNMMPKTNRYLRTRTLGYRDPIRSQTEPRFEDALFASTNPQPQ